MVERPIEEELDLEIEIACETWQCSKCDLENGENECMNQDALNCIQGFYKKKGEWVDD